MVYHEAEVESFAQKEKHTSKLPGVKLQDSIQLTSNLEEAMADKDVLVLAVPSPYTRSTAQKMAPYLKKARSLSTWRKVWKNIR